MPMADLPGAGVYYETHGDGPWLVFAHGAGGNHLSWWQQVPWFARRFRCVVYDQPGWGRSICVGEPTPARFASDLLALLDHLGAERAALVGQSMGGWAVLGAALAAPGRVSHLLLASTLAGLADRRTAAELRAAISADGEPPLDGRAALAIDYPARAPAATFLFTEIAAMNPPLAAPFLRALVDQHLTPPPSPLPFPVAFVAGDRDRLFSQAMIRAAHARLSGAELTVVAGAGHSVYFERPDDFNRALDALLAR
jgi:3-oxoadipate enol-lactonase